MFMDFDLSWARILVVDDEEANLHLLDRILRPSYPNVELLADSRRVADRLVEFAPDIVLVDLHMPHVDGFEVLAIVRGLTQEDAFLPVVMLTADGSSEAKRRALALGATDFLTKPVDVTEVALRVGNLLRTRFLYRQLEERGDRLEIAVGERTRELEGANQRLAELVRSKDEFVASVSHELRTPLSIVVGLAAEVRDAGSEFDPSTLAELVGMIADQSSEVAFIVEDLLVVARADIGTLIVLAERVDIGQELEAALRPLQAEELHRIEKRVSGGIVARADAARLRQILRNLVSNALRYGGPSVDVAAYAGGAWVTVTVSDDGPGLDPAEWERIFDAYHSAHRPNGTPASVGLGLTVSRCLARLMGGDVAYRHDGAHSRFELQLPAWTESEADVRRNMHGVRMVERARV
jgi:two-component system sensor histidine kinase/response regulator